ncbi:cobamide remodeling phosphodiesterase CbiR [Desulfolutivibrio sulfoxidireducens]|uniref:cobamide remodeling phosphodiesterase CbiR n=1 Tax=Desulfolutivibrio sulfoxidireducens TaxID=2773299 RepID=UPI00159E6A60|nr:cobamide remodeling phosphodiesterase CbiR [Desulfolutivibrio sulfoxidireducens]QLA17417.1 xylose isomerase [Desulfolutivibrio sulfoxidireducens]
MPRNCKKNRLWRTAAPSWVIPGTPAENRVFLGDRFADIGLYFLESQGSLAYGPADLPRADGRTAYHMHLPVDLPWETGATSAFEVVARLLAKVEHLAPWGFVLHPPRDPGRLAAFMDLWAAAGHDPADILLENVEEAGPTALWPTARDLGASLCLDVGHLLAFGHQSLLSTPGVFERTRLVHVYAPYDPHNERDAARWLLPEREHRHRTLAALDPAGRAALRKTLAGIGPDTVVMFEVFDDAALSQSDAAFAAMCREWGFVP